MICIGVACVENIWEHSRTFVSHTDPESGCFG
jgi:hypothetical protein